MPKGGVVLELVWEVYEAISHPSRSSSNGVQTACLAICQGEKTPWGEALVREEIRIGNPETLQLPPVILISRNRLVTPDNN